MKRDAFIEFVTECLTEKNMTASEVIALIDEMIEKYGYLDLTIENGNEMIIPSIWLSNFNYKDYIKKFEVIKMY